MPDSKTAFKTFEEGYQNHRPVLRDEITRVFCSGNVKRPKPRYLCDCTFGGGGHTFALIEEDLGINIIAFDQDPEAIDHGQEMIKEKGLEKRVQLIYSNFSQLVKEVEKMGLGGCINGVLFDLGVSSHHLDSPSRGFSFQWDGPLDMRMDYDNHALLAAWEILEQKSEEEIADMIYHYGGEKYSRRIASAICKYRVRNQLRSTKQLENIVFHCYPKRERYCRIHPATKTFQALRLYVNWELEALEQALQGVPQILQEGGQIVVISFHSLEDRIVKHQFREFEKTGKGAVVTPKPIVPTAKELEENRRSRSAKLRVFRKESNWSEDTNG